MVSQPKTASLAASLKTLLRMRRQEPTVGELLSKLEDTEGPGPVLMALTLPVLLPTPPGVSMLLALPLLMVTPQIVLGRRKLWLPGFLSRRTIKRKDLVKAVRRVLPLVTRCEGLVRPRLQVLTSRLGARIVGVVCTAIAVVLVLPIPFANLAPALALGLFALGLTRQDGLMVLGGYAFVAVAVALIVLGVHGVSIGVTDLRALV